MSSDLPYQLGRAERRGAVLGWRPGQEAAAAVGATALVAGIGAGGSLGVALGATGAAVAWATATARVGGRGLDEWVPVVGSHLARLRGGALCAGTSVQPPSGASPAHLRWPDGRATVVAAVRHRGLRALDDVPRAFGESLADWLRGLSSPGATGGVVTLLTTTGPGHVARTAPWADAGRVAHAFVARTTAEPVALAPSLAAAGVAGATELGVDELDALLAARVAPVGGSLLGCDVVARWHHLEAPASVHAAFTVEEWPSGAVDEQVLAPLCVAADRRTVALTLGVEDLQRARERTARVRTAAAADETLGARAGFLASPESARDGACDAARAGELAAGHGSLRLVGVIALDAVDALALEAAAARLLADAAACGVRLRRCDGDHRRGVLASVPGWVVP